MRVKTFTLVPISLLVPINPIDVKLSSMDVAVIVSI